MNALTDLQVDFVALVDRAAVRDPQKKSDPQRLLLWKRDLTNTEGAPMTLTVEETQAALEKAQAEQKKAETDAAEKDTRIAELEAQLAELKGEQADKAEEIDKAELPEPVRAALEKAEQQAAADRERAEKAEKQAGEAAEIAKGERDARLTREFVAKAETLKALPVKPAEFGPILKAASEKLTKDEFDALDTVLKAADEQIQKGDLFKEHGRSGDTAGRGSETALAKAEKAAAEITKADPKISQTDALQRVFKSDPDLASAYLAEQRA